MTRSFFSRPKLLKYDAAFFESSPNCLYVQETYLNPGLNNNPGLSAKFSEILSIKLEF